jgi:class 3 adenylate cyclase/tetratricopeptide (TPR) repeat protein
MAPCPHCGEENPDRARFCLACGTQLEERPPTGEVRKTVTVLFADVKDSTPLGDRLDPEAARGVMNRFFTDVRGVIERHGGTVEKFIGDGVMAVFGTPKVHEDDPLRAVRAATEMRTSLGELNVELEERWGIHLSVRTGINTGKVVAGDPKTRQTFVTGDPVNVGSRLETAAGPGEILIGDATYRLVRDAVLVEPVEPLNVKGKKDPVTAWRVLGVVSGAAPVARRLDSPLVGRERELTMLNHAFERAAADKSCQFVTILGPAGAGKSRLTAELLSELGERATVLVGRCLPYGEGITFWPVVDIVKQAASLGPSLAAEESHRRLAAIVENDPEAGLIVDRLGTLFGIGSGPGGRDEIFWAVRRLLQALARERPVVVVFEDVHWGEQTFLDLVDHITDWARDTRILLICLARGELLEERPTWAGGKLNATSLFLEPLPDEACGTLIENLLDRTAVATEVKERISHSAEGNPLFVEELLAMLIDEGALQREQGRWVATTDLSSLAVPPTIQALLDARLDRLPAPELGVLERAAVAGRIFSRSAVRVLSPPENHPLLDDGLAELVRKQLIRPHHAEFGRENTYRFRHSLIRDAAYRQMPKAARADLHERFAGWLEGAGGPRSAEQEEILGYHLEQAHRFRRELGGPSAAEDALARRGAASLASAGSRAIARGDMAAAVGLLTRAQLLVADDDTAWLEFAPELGTALIETGELERADAILSRAIEQAATAQNERIHALTHLERSYLRLHTDPAGTSDELRESAEHARSVFEKTGDDAGLAKAWKYVALLEWTRCQLAEMEAVLERSLEYARRAGDARELSIIRNALARAALLGPRPVPDALRVCAHLREEAPTDRSLDGVLCTIEGALTARLGRFDEARVLTRRSEAIFRDLGLSLHLAGLHQYSAGIELLADDPVAAERELRVGYDDYVRMGERARLSTTAALLAVALHAQGRDEEAHRCTVVSEESASPDDLASQVFWRETRARVLARRREVEDALRLGREAVDLASGTDFISMHGDALVGLAEVLRVAGSPSESNEAAEQALALYEAKGDLVSAGKTRALIADLRHRP